MASKSTMQITLMAGALVLAIAFQNCTGQMATNAPVAKAETSSSGSGSGTGNGHSYDGKTRRYVTQVKVGTTCPDGGTISSEILVSETGAATMVRQDCMNIAPRSLEASLWQSLFGGQYLLFGDFAFQLDSTMASGMVTSFVCKDASQSTTVILSSSADGLTAQAQFAVSGKTSDAFVAQAVMQGVSFGYRGQSSDGDTLEILMDQTTGRGYMPGHLDLSFAAGQPANIVDLPMDCYAHIN